MAKPVPRLSPDDIKRIIEIAWDDRPPFSAVLRSHGLSPGQVVQLLKRELTPNAFKNLDRAHPTRARADAGLGTRRAAPGTPLSA